ncbi:unnamed protein product, partial [Rotaria magnacalcarata]
VPIGSVDLGIRQILLENNYNPLGTFNSFFVASEAHVLENEYACANCNEMYGDNYIKDSQRLAARMEPNETVVKMILMILGFSSNCSIVLPVHRFSSMMISSITSLILSRIQHRFIVLLWKYIVYQYGFKDGV